MLLEALGTLVTLRPDLWGPVIAEEIVAEGTSQTMLKLQEKILEIEGLDAVVEMAGLLKSKQRISRDFINLWQNQSGKVVHILEDS